MDFCLGFQLSCAMKNFGIQMFQPTGCHDAVHAIGLLVIGIREASHANPDLVAQVHHGGKNAWPLVRG